MEQMPNWLMQRAYMTPHREALRFEGRSWTFRELEQQASRFAKKMVACGITPHARVALLGYSTAEFVQVIYACMQLQLEMVMLNNRLSDEELQYQLEDSEATALLIDARFADRVTHANTWTFARIAQAEETDVTISTTWQKEATMTVMYTSGTTGFPKGVRQTVRNHEASALASALNLGVRPDDVWFCATPIFHISGFSTLTKSLLYGMTVDLYEKFDETEAALSIASGRATMISVVALTLSRILTVMEQRQLTAHPRFVTMLAGGGPIPRTFLERAQALNVPVAQTYGMTETASQTTTLQAEEAFTKLGSAGKPLFFNTVRIDGATKPGEEGEICIQGPHVTPGYIGRFADRSPLNNGWLHSGDIGYIDEDGYLFVVDRRADLIISGGENIYPAQIENVLHSHPAVVEAGVCGVADAQWGQVPAAFVVVKEQVSEEQLRAHCLQKLARYKVPKAFYIVEELPRNGANKLMRRKLIDLQKDSE